MSRAYFLALRTRQRNKKKRGCMARLRKYTIGLHIQAYSYSTAARARWRVPKVAMEEMGIVRAESLFSFGEICEGQKDLKERFVGGKAIKFRKRGAWGIRSRDEKQRLERNQWVHLEIQIPNYRVLVQARPCINHFAFPLASPRSFVSIVLSRPSLHPRPPSRCLPHHGRCSRPQLVLTCNRHIDSDENAPYCSRECLSLDKPSTSLLTSTLMPPPVELARVRTTRSSTLKTSRMSALGFMRGRGKFLQAHPSKLATTPAPPCVTKAAPPPPRMPPSLFMTKTDPAPPQPSRPIFTPQKSVPTLLSSATASATSLTTGSSSLSIITPPSVSEVDASHAVPSSLHSANLIGAITARFRTWTTSAVQKDSRREATVTRRPTWGTESLESDSDYAVVDVPQKPHSRTHPCLYADIRLPKSRLALEEKGVQLPPAALREKMDDSPLPSVTSSRRELLARRPSCLSRPGARCLVLFRDLPSPYRRLLSSCMYSVSAAPPALFRDVEDWPILVPGDRRFSLKRWLLPGYPLCTRTCT
ncbi:hypothetical protein A0H81_13538 [Grifola frondosa]|uniref:Uncharacterized protein n=1 Tax=Grifola frondosa TaxID=5627 RepID=A0A1C7LR31_GRIFR|nr:hypothetical protein A0H81_13538 [Grifola frondosa]